MRTEPSLYDIASTQGGVVRREQAIQSGLSKRQIEHRVTEGDWATVTAGGYRIIAMSGQLNLARSAVALLPGACVSHFSAAAIHRLRMVPTDEVSVTVHARTTHTFPGVRVFRSFDLAATHMVEHKGLPVTSLPRTVVDIAACIPQRRLEAAVDELLADQRIGVAEIREVLDAVARRGRNGVVSLRSILDARSDGPVKASRLERIGLSLLRSAQFASFKLEYAIPWAPRQRFDVAFPLQRLAIEWDSRRWHTQKQAFDRDRERDRVALEHGWRILRFTWSDVSDRPDLVVESIRTVLDS